MPANRRRSTLHKLSRAASLTSWIAIQVLGAAAASADTAGPAGAASAAPQARFEGVLRRVGTVETQKLDQVLYVRENGDVRQDMIEKDQVKASMLRKHGEKSLVVLRHKEKVAMRVALPDLPDGGKPPTGVRVDKLGVEKVAGVDADHLRIMRGADRPVDLWVTRFIPVDDADLSATDALLMPDVAQDKQVDESDVGALRAELRRRGVTGFVLKLSAARAPGLAGLQLKREVTSVQPKRLSPSLFEIPKEYTVSGEAKTAP